MLSSYAGLGKFTRLNGILFRKKTLFIATALKMSKSQMATAKQVPK